VQAIVTGKVGRSLNSNCGEGGIGEGACKAGLLA
jgi:hypothetical protein